MFVYRKPHTFFRYAFVALATLSFVSQTPVLGQVPEPEVTLIEQEAEFPGGIPAYISNLATTLGKELANRKYTGTGTLEATFRLGKPGKVEEVRITKSLDSIADAQLKQVIAGGRVWMPAVQNGQTVPVNIGVTVSISPEAAGPVVRIDRLDYLKAVLQATAVKKDGEGKAVITGKVTDRLGNPLPGASVVVTDGQGKMIAAGIAGSSGAFEVQALQAAVVVVSHVGYASRKVVL